MTAGPHRPPQMSDDLNHHTTDGRNVIPSGQGHAGHDIFFAAVQMSRMPMVLTDPHQADNPIIFCNQAFQKLTGYDESEIIGRNCRFLQGEATDRDAVQRVRDSIARQEDVQEELFNYRKDGSGFWNALFVSPVFDPTGKLLYFFASQLDITRRREAEAVLQQAQRLETLGTMASGVAHEFNNLMTIVMGSLAQLEKGFDPESRERQRLDRATWAAQQAGRLTQQMLSFARRQFHDNQVVDLNELLSNFDGIMRQMAGDKVQLSLDLCNDPIIVTVDPSQMEMALLNLVRNAKDAMNEGGPLVISTVRAVQEADESRALVKLVIKDSGEGMSEATRHRAIEPFFTTKPQGVGTGLGLSMVNGFAAQSGGRLEIQSAENKGTIITIVLPTTADTFTQA